MLRDAIIMAEEERSEGLYFQVDWCGFSEFSDCVNVLSCDVSFGLRRPATMGPHESADSCLQEIVAPQEKMVEFQK